MGKRIRIYICERGRNKDIYEKRRELATRIACTTLAEADKRTDVHKRRKQNTYRQHAH